MVILGEVEGRRVQDFRRDRAHSALAQCVLIGSLRRLGCGALRRRGHVDAGAVLRADIVALAHALSGVMAFPEGLEQPLIGELFRVVDDQHHLVVAGQPRADLLVGRIGRMPARVADRGHEYAVAELPEHPLRPPEAAEAENCRLHPQRIGALQRPAVDKMRRRRRDRLTTPGQRLIGTRHRGLLAEQEHGAPPFDDVSRRAAPGRAVRRQAASRTRQRRE